MSINSYSALYPLIKSLSKAEKRHFKLYANRNNSSDDIKYLQLFDTIDKLKEPQDESILKRLPYMNKASLANVSRHLYGEILKSLRLFHTNHDAEIAIREKIDYARILYGKGFYLAALKTLEQAELAAESNNLDLIRLEIVEFLKLIESRHITRSRTKKYKVEDVINDSVEMLQALGNNAQSLNASIQIHGYYIRNGHCRNETDHSKLRQYFNRIMNTILQKPTSFYESVHWNQCYMWYYFTDLDMPNFHHHSARWVQLFEENPNMKSRDPDLYLRGLHYAMSSARRMSRWDIFNKYFQKLQVFYQVKQDSFNTTTKIFYFIYGLNAKLLAELMYGFSLDTDTTIQQINDDIKRYKNHVDSHRIVVFYYKIAYTSFIRAAYITTINYCDKVFLFNKGMLKNETQIYNKFLLALSYFELKNYSIALNFINSSIKEFIKFDPSNKIMIFIIQFMKSTCEQKLTLAPEDWIKLQNEIKEYAKDKYMLRINAYFDYDLWILSKIKSISLEQAYAQHITYQAFS